MLGRTIPLSSSLETWKLRGNVAHFKETQTWKVLRGLENPQKGLKNCYNLLVTIEGARISKNILSLMEFVFWQRIIKTYQHEVNPISAVENIKRFKGVFIPK